MLGDKVIVTVRVGTRVEEQELRVNGAGGSVELDTLDGGFVRAQTLTRRGVVRERLIVGPEALVSARLVLR